MSTEQPPPPPPGFYLHQDTNKHDYKQPEHPPEYSSMHNPPSVPPYSLGPHLPKTAMDAETGVYPVDSFQSEPYAFSDKSIRRGFIRKVYSILMAQLAITTGVIAFFMYHEPTKQYAKTNMVIILTSAGVMFACLICIVCCTSVRRKAPMNFIFLGIFTLAMGSMLGCSAVFFEIDEVIMAAGITALVCFALTIFAFQTKWDFTLLGGSLYVALIILLIFGSLFASLPAGRRGSILYSCFSAFLFSAYLIYDTQLMMGGKHRYSISPEEYIFAALNLYLDVINLFLIILRLIGRK